MKPSRVHEVLRQCLATNWPAFLWGPPGVGKSSVVRAVARELDMAMIDLRAILLDPTDLRGIPYVQDGMAQWATPSFLPNGRNGEKGILFLDELNAAPALVQASLYQLTLDRRIGDYELPPGWRILAAGNRSQDGAVTFRMPSALANRFIHVDFEVDLRDWRDWAIDNGIHPLVLGFLSFRSELLHKHDNRASSFPTPRSWEMVSDLLRIFDGPPEQAADIIAGAVGEPATVEFLAYSNDAVTSDKIQAILEDPHGTSIPRDLGKAYAIVSWFCANHADPTAREAAGHILGRLPVELGVVLTRDLLRRHVSFGRHPGYRSFIDKHGRLLS